MKKLILSILAYLAMVSVAFAQTTIPRNHKLFGLGYFVNSFDPSLRSYILVQSGTWDGILADQISYVRCQRLDLPVGKILVPAYNQLRAKLTEDHFDIWFGGDNWVYIRYHDKSENCDLLKHYLDVKK